jgi:hypothetical protein
VHRLDLDAGKRHRFRKFHKVTDSRNGLRAEKRPRPQDEASDRNPGALLPKGIGCFSADELNPPGIDLLRRDCAQFDGIKFLALGLSGDVAGDLAQRLRVALKGLATLDHQAVTEERNRENAGWLGASLHRVADRVPDGLLHHLLQWPRAKRLVYAAPYQKLERLVGNGEIKAPLAKTREFFNYGKQSDFALSVRGQWFEDYLLVQSCRFRRP